MKFKSSINHFDEKKKKKNFADVDRRHEHAAYNGGETIAGWRIARFERILSRHL